MSETLEEPKYDLIRNFDSFEVRHYHNTIQARVSTSEEGWSGASSSFRTIARYIFGSNSSGEKIAMTAPVHQWQEQGMRKMAFTMPSEHNLSDLPLPTDSSVELLEVTGMLTAAMKFSGFSGYRKVERLSNKLFKLITLSGFESTGPYILAVYDPPSTFPFFRRNEILIPIKNKF
jgi:hypothetical protein|tara:strand:+ start:2727 stop:3251 length:525 start_codon:yes stop_codon:yes gene_type:complete